MANTAVKKMQRLVGAGALALAALPAMAGSISDRLTVYKPDSSVYASVWVDEVNEDPNQFYYINDASLIDPAEFGNATALIEPGGDSVNGPFSDIFGIGSPNPTASNPDFCLGFQSDGDPGGSLDTAGITIFLPEVDGASYDASRYLAPNLLTLGYTATFEVGNIPEPGSLALLGLGTLALSAYRRTVRRT